MAAISEYTPGRKVQLVLKSKSKVEGVVFAVDLEGNRIVLEEAIAGGPTNIRNTRIVNLLAVETATFDPSPPIVLEPLIALTKEQALKREKSTFRAHEEALLRAGPVQEIQDSLSRMMYENLSKTYECRWNDREKKIDIADLGVSIKHPYRLNDVSGRDARAVKWVREIIAKLNHPK
jgi:hypothetical protein